mmetsp:Transcript_26416/g.57929  ORF Transcript_26416/g.57929 Transcript_26416/m.57929 type:complete len:220 (+) Transcript_26416:93-752(+)
MMFLFTLALVAAVSAFIGVEAFAPLAKQTKHYHVAQPKLVGANSSGMSHTLFFPTSRQPRQTLLTLSMRDETNDDEIVQSSNVLSTPLDRPVLAAVDMVALIGFAAVGKASHSADGGLDVGAVLATSFPFVTSWLLTSPLTGVYTEDSKDGNVVSEAFAKAAKGWVVAVPIGIALRGVIKGYVPPVSFVIVSLIATLVILGGSRVLFTIAEDFFVEMVN